MTKNFFGKFQNSKIKFLLSIKGGSVIGDTSTTLCTTGETTFDTDSQIAYENLMDERCAQQFK
jgi:hypothetical protein